MSPTVRGFMVVLSDVSLVLMIIAINTLAAYAWAARKRNGRVLRRLAEFLVVLAMFFDWFTIVYWDRRWNVWPWASLYDVMGFEWYWVPRLALCGATASLLWALMGTRRT